MMTTGGSPAQYKPVPAPVIDSSVAHPARRYDYLLGGKDNFKADRDSAEALLKVFPAARTAAVQNRRFLRRVVGWLAEQQGITQFLDIGTGIPTSPNTHEVAQAIHPDARVVYVDNDPLVLAHARALLTGTLEGRTAYTDADLTWPGDILRHPDLRATLDLSRPVGLLLVAVLHFQPDTDLITRVLTELTAPLASGSFVAVTHTTYDPLPEQQRRRLQAELANTDRHGTICPRTRQELQSVLDGLSLQPDGKGLVSVVDWRPDLHPSPGDRASEADAIGYAYVARRP